MMSLTICRLHIKIRNENFTETKVVYKNVTKIDVVCKKNVAKKIRNGLTGFAILHALRAFLVYCKIVKPNL